MAHGRAQPLSCYSWGEGIKGKAWHFAGVLKLGGKWDGETELSRSIIKMPSSFFFSQSY